MQPLAVWALTGCSKFDFEIVFFKSLQAVFRWPKYHEVAMVFDPYRDDPVDTQRNVRFALRTSQNHLQPRLVKWLYQVYIEARIDRLPMVRVLAVAT